jgi:hypothetical protein
MNVPNSQGTPNDEYGRVPRLGYRAPEVPPGDGRPSATT